MRGTSTFGRLPTMRVIVTDLGGAPVASAVLSGTANVPVAEGAHEFEIRGAAATDDGWLLRMHDSGGGETKEIYVMPSAVYTNTLISGLTVTMAAAFTSGDKTRIEVTREIQLPGGTTLAKVTSAAGSAVATGFTRIWSVTLVPQGNAADTTVTIYDNTSAAGTKKLDAVPLIDAMGIRQVHFDGLVCSTGIYAVVSKVNCHVIVEYSQ